MIESGFTIPLMSPPYGRPPYPVEDARLVIIRFRADPEVVASVVPAPLAPIGDGVVTAFVGEMWQSRGPGAYLEGGLTVGVTYNCRPSSYAPILLTSTEDALYVGREVFGLPKLMCDGGTVETVGNGRKARLSRAGEPIITLSVSLDDHAEGNQMLPHDRYMLKKIPSPDPEFPSITHLVHQRLTGHRVVKAFKGRGHLKLGGDLHINLERFAAREVLGAWFVQASWDVPPAKVIEEVRETVSARVKRQEVTV